MSERLQLALDLAAEASIEIAAAFSNRKYVTKEKSSNDFATETDATVEAHIANRIATTFPGDLLLGEEGGERGPYAGAPVSGYRWIVDPLDGTFNFLHGFPYIATSIAVEHEGVIVAGVVTNPISDEVFYAERGRGAWLLGIDGEPPQPLRVSDCDALSRALVGSVLPSGASPSYDQVFPAWSGVARVCGSIRRTGAAALDLAQLAAGRLDGFFVMSLAAWDAAAGSLLVEEAGGRICDFNGGDRYLESNQVIAGSAAVCSDLVRVLSHYAKPVKR